MNKNAASGSDTSRTTQNNGETPTLEDTIDHINFLDSSSYGAMTTKEIVKEVYKYLKKDNPVPSLDKIKEFLQNGVETDNEQPIKSGHTTEISWGS